MVLQLTVFWYSGAVLGHVCLGLGPWACWLRDHVAQLGFLFPLGVCVVLWSVGCKSTQFLFIHLSATLLVGGGGVF